MARAKRHYIAGFDDYDTFRQAHREWVESSLANGRNVCDTRWTRSIAVGGAPFVRKIKESLGWKAWGRRICEVPGGYELRERSDTYIAHFGPQKGEISLENTCRWGPFP